MLGIDGQKQVEWRKAAAREAAAAKRREELDHEIRSNTISVEDDAGFDSSSLLTRLGHPLTSIEVIRRLKLCNPHLIFERSIRNPELYGIYYERDERTPAGTWEKRKVHICGMEAGIMPEFNVMHKTKQRVPDPELIGNKTPIREVDWKYVDTYAGETRGWRTVLLRLMHQELINRHQVEKHFGWNPSKESRRWHSQTT